MNKHKRRTTPEINSRRSGARVLRSCPGLLPQAAAFRHPLSTAAQPPVRIFPARNSGRNQMSSIEKVRLLRYSSSPAGVVKTKRSL